MHLSANEGIEANTFVVTGALGFVGSALCLELVRRGALQVRAFDLRPASPWSDDLKIHGVKIIQGSFLSAIRSPSFTVCFAISLGGATIIFHLYACTSIILALLVSIEIFLWLSFLSPRTVLSEFSMICIFSNAYLLQSL